MKKVFRKYDDAQNCVYELKLIQDNLDYDFRNLELSLLAQKIKSQHMYKPKPKMFYY